MAKRPARALSLVRAQRINGVDLEANQVVGHMEGDRPVSTVEGVRPDHIEARLRRGLIVEDGEPPARRPPATDSDLMAEKPPSEKSE